MATVGVIVNHGKDIYIMIERPGSNLLDGSLDGSLSF